MSCDYRCEDPRDPMYDPHYAQDCGTCLGRDSGPAGPTGTNVIHATFGTPGLIEREMIERVKEVIYEYAGRISVAQALGVLEMLKAKIKEEQ